MTNRSRSSGFTLLELLVVIGIIAILAGLLFVGYNAIRRSQDERNTRAALEVARTMFNQYVNSARAGGNDMSGGAKNVQFYIRLAPSTWQINDVNFNSGPLSINHTALMATAEGTPTKDYARSIDFYNVPSRDGSLATGTPIPMDVPQAAVQSSIATDRNALNWSNATNWQLVETMNAIRRMRSSPEAKATWGTLRETQIVQVGHAAGTDTRQDFIVDAWGHPLLFVPGSGLRGVRYGEGALSGTPSYVAPVSGQLDRQSIRSPDGRAFWVSAGPDGYFDSQDDNLYSFDN